MSTKLTESAIEYHSGETVSIPITVLDDDDVAVDMTAATITFAIVRKIGGTAVISTAAGTASSSISSNVVTITISATNTEPLVGLYRFECRAVDGSSNEAVIAYGTINFKKNQLT